MINPILALRITQAVLALILLGTAAHVVDSFVGTSDAANFMVFSSLWTFVALGYVVATPVYFPNFHNRWAVLGVEAITMVFWFAGFIALAAENQKMICLNAPCAIPTAKAVIVFGAFEWLAWAITLGLVVRALIQYGKGEPTDAEGIQPPPPPPLGRNSNSSPSSSSSSSFHPSSLHSPSLHSSSFHSSFNSSSFNSSPYGEEILSPNVETNGGTQFKHRTLVPDEPPSLPELDEFGNGLGQEGFGIGDPLEMPQVGGSGGNER